MKDFDASVEAARRRSRNLFIGAVTVFIVAVLGVSGFLMSSKGVAIAVLPPDAEETAQIRIVDGIGATVGDAIYSLGGELDIEIAAVGYRTSEKRITALDLGRTLEVELRPIPAVIQAKAIPELDEAAWVIGETMRMTGATVEVEVEPGEYDVSVSHPFYRSQRQTVTVEKAETVQLDFELEPAKGTLLVKTAPTGVDVRINGAVVGQSPIEAEVEAGVLDILVSLEGYIDVTDRVRIDTERPSVERNYALQPLPGELTVRASPSGGLLIVGGKSAVLGQAVKVPSRRETRIRYQKDGYRAYSETVSLAPLESRTIELELEPAVASVTIEANVGADITVNGDTVGQGPLTLTLPAVDTTISAQFPGYVGEERTLRLEADKRYVATFNLKTEKQSALAKSPSVYTNSLGMQFKLFEPTTFTMGAPRHEPGQRANEFLRPVSLTRHFYAGLHEVTNANYASCTGDPQDGPGSLPRVNISWNQAAKFANCVSVREGRKLFYRFSGDRLEGIDRSADGYRLLTEAEWEYLARSAGRNGAVVFPWGNTTVIPRGAANIADESARGGANRFVPNYNDGYARLSPVGSYSVEASGLFDQAGNASEWVHDRYSVSPPPTDSVSVDPLGARRGDTRVVKGASFRSGTKTTLRPAYREGGRGPRDDLGFRLGRYIYGE
ncbi:MAG: SUMF1/EgtB/PvdO family nonheme iron enzyme [Alphaproteobacteria bacterium]|nr:SUMF1/EgtB/PvdO family nonheme iron enzyme [Alphaproteobacteria bacterium]